jgi:hypothetical protein
MFGLPTEVHYCSARTNIFRSIAHNIPTVRYSGCKGQNRSSSRGTAQHTADAGTHVERLWRRTGARGRGQVSTLPRTTLRKSAAHGRRASAPGREEPSRTARQVTHGIGRGLWGTVAAEQPQSTACTSGVFPAPAGGGGQVPEATT